jgi:hypothetical protein
MNPSIKRNLRMNNIDSPIVEKLRNPISTKNNSMKTAMILISPRILKSASKQMQHTNKIKSQFSSDDSYEKIQYNIKGDELDNDDYLFSSLDHI